MSGVDVAFGLLALAAVVSGWRTFRTQSMVRASFLLLLSFIAVAAMLLLLSAPYIGIATVFMMAVEMMVMALFMVMFMMNPAGLNPMAMMHQRRFAIVAGAVAFAGLTAAVLLSDLPSHPLAAGRPVIHDLGIELLGDSMLIFETAGVTLLATMIGAVVLSNRSGRFGPADVGSVPPPLEPDGQPAGQVPEKKSGHGHGMHHGHTDHADHADHAGDVDHPAHAAHAAVGAEAIDGANGQQDPADPPANPHVDPHAGHPG